MFSDLYDPFSEHTVNDPFPGYRRLRDEFPVYHNERRAFFALSRWDDVTEAARDWQTYTTAEGVDLDDTGSILFGEGNVVENDPPEHTMLRDILKTRLTPAVVRSMEPLMTKRIDDLMTRIADAGSVDLVADFCIPLPLSLICDLLGVDGTDQSWFYDHFVHLFRRDANTQGIPGASLESMQSVRDFIRGELAVRRRAPREDLLTAVAHGKKNGETPLTENEQVGMATLAISAGIATTKNLLGTIFWYLARSPQLRREVEEERNNAAGVVEEFLRFDSPIQASARTLRRDVELHGVTMPKGSKVVLLYGSANRDGSKFEDPDKLDVRRRINKQMSFGGGVHLCLGAPLARLEAKLVLEHALPKMRPFALGGDPVRAHMWNERGLEEMPVEFGMRGRGTQPREVRT